MTISSTHDASPDRPRALIVAPSWIGDTLMAHALFMRLLARTPTLALDALAPPWVAPILRRMPEIADVIDLPFAHGELALGQRWRLARTLTRRGYRQAYVLPNSAKSALIPTFAGIPERIGFTGEARYGLINRRHRLDPAALPQMAERFAQLAEAPGAPLARPLPTPRLSSSPAQQADALAALQLDRPARLAVFCPGAEYGPAKRWPTRHFATLAGDLANHGYAVWMFGSAKDRPLGDEIAGLAQRAGAQAPLNLCGRTTLTQAVDLIAQAQVAVCNDSGLMHVAAALGRPLVALYGSSSPAFTPPLTEQAHILSLGLPCSPCFERVCPLGHFDCLTRLTPERVLDACLAAAHNTETTDAHP